MDTYHSACACPELESFVLLTVVQRYPGRTKRIVAYSALSSLKRDLPEERQMLTYIDSLVTTKLLYRHDFGFYLTPSGSKRLERLKDSLRETFLRTQA